MAGNDNAEGGGSCRRFGTRLAWGAWIALAAVSYLALHALALRPQTIDVDAADVGAALAGFLLGGVVESLQYAVPALCLSALLGRLAHVPEEARIGPGALRRAPADADADATVPPPGEGDADALAIRLS
ncbi:hypothetical protein [Ramlibacter alkalitolerans]|uniref:DNA translocase FtsK 4TM region domain-containing protein n=1 Tax=Ramlibacter alkalitolerans TaxID=2039631 RepID=A0ABS1JJB0_9BURK|nr:hypothetical protein [Ramlibacter alkalitolerans]MBL0424308.1 hypothetical protein [Ramlibacter alkalitolerans]